MRFIYIILCSLFFLPAFSTEIRGIITDEGGQPLPFASLTVKGTNIGAIANSKGNYSIQISPGSYTLLCQHVGYTSVEKKIAVSGAVVELNFQLSIQELKMDEVVIKRGVDPAIEIIRQTIKKREYYNKQVDSFTVDVYIKGLMRSRAIPDKVLGQKIDKKNMAKEGIDSSGKGILFLSETVTKVAFKKPETYKYEVVSSRQSGGGFGLSFPFFINFYSGNVSVFNNNINPRGFISPIADNAFHFYSFKYEGAFFEGDKMINRIKVTPKRKNEPLFTGFIQIIDGEWRLHSVDLLTTKDYQLDLIDSLRIKQIHSPVASDVWRTQNQVVYIAANMFGFDITGDFLNVYSNYNINPGFAKKYFNNIYMKYDSTYNKKDSSYWATVRPVALEPDEKQDFQFKDSVNKAEREMFSKRNIDSLRKTRQKVTIKSFLTTGIRRDFYSSTMFSTYRIPSLLGGLSYNSVEGASVKINQALEIKPRNGNLNYNLNWNTRYGLSNSHLNSYVALNVKPKRDAFRNRFFELSGGKRFSQFNHDDPIDEFTNSIYTLFYQRNYMKVYENWFAKGEYNNKFESGLQLNVNATYENRIPVFNTTDFSVFKNNNTQLPNHPFELAHIPFNNHAALSTSITMSFQPGLRFIQLPRSKIPIGSKYPTLELQYSKGVPGLLNSVVDFDKWKFSVYDQMNLKLAGAFKYRLSIGGFLNSKHVEIPDFQHFNGNQTFYNTKYGNSFQLAPYYQYSNTESFYSLLHAEHHFNGLFTNKIPLFNKLKWNLVVGTNTFYVNTNNYYVEAFAGLENIFKIFRLDFVTATQALPGRTFGVRMGFGGILGGAVASRAR